MQTEAEICNISLGLIGDRDFIQALDTEGSTESQACAVHFAHCRNVVLEAFPWPFATKRAVLAVLEDADDEDSDARTNWGFVYALPTDCVTVQGLVIEGTRTPPSESRIPYTLEHDSVTGKAVLLTDLEDAELVYTARLTAVGLFPALFIDALAWKLAAALAFTIPGKAALAAGMLEGYGRALAMAGAAAFNQSQEDVEPESQFVRVRG